MDVATYWNRARSDLRAAGGLLHDSLVGWSEDNVSRKGAALAFYTVFSLAPILVMAVGIAGVFFGEGAARSEIVAQVRGLIGGHGAGAVEEIIQNSRRPGAGITATVVGAVTLLVGATTALAELKDGLDQIWRVPEQRRTGFWYFVRKRVLSVGLILALCFLLLVSLVVSAAVTALERFWGADAKIGAVIASLNSLISLLLVAGLFAAIYKLLPSVQITWRDATVGAMVTALLFDIGKYLIGVYLGNSGISSAYGAAGSVVVVLVWVYYSAQIFLFGAEFTRSYAHRYGSLRGRVESGSQRM